MQAAPAAVPEPPTPAASLVTPAAVSTGHWQVHRRWAPPRPARQPLWMALRPMPGHPSPVLARPIWPTFCRRSCSKYGTAAAAGAPPARVVHPSGDVGVAAAVAAAPPRRRRRQSPRRPSRPTGRRAVDGVAPVIHGCRRRLLPRRDRRPPLGGRHHPPPPRRRTPPGRPSATVTMTKMATETAKATATVTQRPLRPTGATGQVRQLLQDGHPHRQWSPHNRAPCQDGTLTTPTPTLSTAAPPRLPLGCSHHHRRRRPDRDFQRAMPPQPTVPTAQKLPPRSCHRRRQPPPRHLPL